MLQKCAGPLPSTGRAIVFDVEYTSWSDCNPGHDRQPGRYPEIIQIGAVKIDLAKDCTERDAFDVFVIPSINPKLSDHIVALTGITQAALESKGKTFAAALTDFEIFVGTDTDAVMSYGFDADIIRENCGLNGLALPSFLPNEYDLRDAFVSNELVPKTLYSGELASWLDLDVPGRAHDGLHDARSLAAALRHFRSQEKI